MSVDEAVWNLKTSRYCGISWIEKIYKSCLEKTIYEERRTAACGSVNLKSDDIGLMLNSLPNSSDRISGGRDELSTVCRTGDHLPASNKAELTKKFEFMTDQLSRLTELTTESEVSDAVVQEISEIRAVLEIMWQEYSDLLTEQQTRQIMEILYN